MVDLLLVEDNPTFSNSLRTRFEVERFSVHVVRTVRPAGFLIPPEAALHAGT